MINARHLQGPIRRIEANEKILKIIVTGQLVDLIYEHIDPKVATKIEEIYVSLSADEGKYLFEDFRNAVNQALATEKTVPPRVELQIKVCFDYLFPSPLPA